MRFATFGCAVGALAACAPQSASLSLEDATTLCTQRAIAFGQRPWNAVHPEPPNNVVQDRFRACVFANSGAYPAAKVQWRRPPPTPAEEAGS